MGDVITQLQLKRALRIPAAFTDDDVLLETDIIPEAEDELYRALGSWVGGLVSAPRTETHRVVSRRQDLLVLKIRPIQSVESVTDSVAGGLAPSAYTLDTQTGILRRIDDRAFTCGARVTVAYTAGLIVGDPPGSLRRACLLMAIERYNSDPLAGLHAEKMDGHSRTRADHDATLERLLADWVGAI